MERLPGAQHTEDVVWLLLFIRALVHLCSWTHQEYCWIECESKKRTLDIFISCVASRLGQRTFISCISSSSTFFVPPRNGLLLRYDDGISWMSANARVFIYMCVCVWCGIWTTSAYQISSTSTSYICIQKKTVYHSVWGHLLFHRSLDVCQTKFQANRRDRCGPQTEIMMRKYPHLKKEPRTSFDISHFTQICQWNLDECTERFAYRCAIEGIKPCKSEFRFGTETQKHITSTRIKINACNAIVSWIGRCQNIQDSA